MSGDTARRSAQWRLVFGDRDLPKTFHESYGLEMDGSEIFNLYLQVAPGEMFGLLQKQMGKTVRNGIYSARLVIWMMMHQRLQPQGTLAHSVGQLVQGRFDALLSRCKRVRDRHIAVSTGG